MQPPTCGFSTTWCTGSYRSRQPTRRGLYIVCLHSPRLQFSPNGRRGGAQSASFPSSSEHIASCRNRLADASPSHHSAAHSRQDVQFGFGAPDGLLQKFHVPCKGVVKSTSACTRPFKWLPELGVNGSFFSVVLEGEMGVGAWPYRCCLSVVRTRSCARVQYCSKDPRPHVC